MGKCASVAMKKKAPAKKSTEPKPKAKGKAKAKAKSAPAPAESAKELPVCCRSYSVESVQCGMLWSRVVAMQCSDSAVNVV